MRYHISLRVKDVAASVAFYDRLFGAQPQKQTAGYAKYDLQSPPLNFSLTGAGQGAPSRVGHLGIEVDSPEQLAAWQSRLERAGIAVRAETATRCCFALQDKLWSEDPDHNAWEVFLVREQLPVADDPAAGAGCGSESPQQGGCCG